MDLVFKVGVLSLILMYCAAETPFLTGNSYRVYGYYMLNSSKDFFQSANLDHDVISGIFSFGQHIQCAGRVSFLLLQLSLLFRYYCVVHHSWK